MKLKYTFAIAALALSTAAQSQTWIHDTISTGSGYLKNVYYGLEQGSAAVVDADNWHVGFSTSAYSASIITNSADKAVRLFVLDSDTASFGTNLTTALTNAIALNPMPLYNSNLTWENGAFNNTTAATYGWGVYNQTSHWIEGRKIFGLITATDTFQIFVVDKQTYQVTNAPVYNFKIAKINGTGAITKTLTIGASSYVGKNFAYYNIETDAFVDREPLSANWDFVFSNYNDAAVAVGNQQYKVFGVINNEGLRVAKVDTADAEFDNLNYANYTYDTVNNSIGRAWKAAGMGGITMTDSLTYFVKVSNGDVWQLVFTDHKSGSDTSAPGLVALKKRKVFEVPVDTSTSVNEVSAYVGNLIIAPNPSEGGSTNVLVDAKQQLNNAQLIITDINGRIVMNQKMNINKGFQQIRLDVGTFRSGLYLISLSGAGFNTTQKLVVK